MTTFKTQYAVVCAVSLALSAVLFSVAYAGGDGGGGGGNGGPTGSKGLAAAASGSTTSNGMCGNTHGVDATASPVARGCCSGKDCDPGNRCTGTVVTPKPQPKPNPKPPVTRTNPAGRPGGTGGTGGQNTQTPPRNPTTDVTSSTDGGFSDGGFNSGTTNTANTGNTVTLGSVHIDVRPSLVRAGTAATVTWSSTSAEDCMIAGPGLSETSKSGSSQIVIQQESTFTISCDVKPGSGVFSATDTATVHILPTFIEL